jgi:hypothetical protein
VSVIVTAEIDPVLMIDGKAPGTHFGRQGTVELLHLTRVRVDSKKEKRGIVLPEGKVNRIGDSRFSWTGIGTPDDGLAHGYAEVLLSD